MFAAGLVVLSGSFGLLCARAAAPASSEKTEEPLPPEEVFIETADGVELAATFYPSRLGKSAVPIILLHMQGRDQRDWNQFAARLQEEQYAVLTFDLRGHGESTTVDGEERALEAARLYPADYQDMAYVELRRDFTRAGGDLETARDFLLEKHNQGQLNIAKLGIVAAEMSTGVALRWAQRDWELSEQRYGRKVGEDVKMLVLLSPEWSYDGLDVRDALLELREHIAMLFIEGEKNRRRRTNTARMYQLVSDWQERVLKRTGADKMSFLREYDTSLAGTAMLGKNLGVEEHILKFFKLTLDREEMRLPWVDRRGVFAAP